MHSAFGFLSLYLALSHQHLKPMQLKSSLLFVLLLAAAAHAFAQDKSSTVKKADTTTAYANDNVPALVESPAIFEGGEQEWYRFLENNLKANTACKAGLPQGKYAVKVQFIVDKEGKVGDIEVINPAPFCSACDAEAVRVIKKSPWWTPAYRNGKAMRYRAVEKITFSVEEEDAKPKKKS